MREMHSEEELKRLRWRAHHRGTKEADILVGGFFDSHHRRWTASELALFGQLLEEQDADIIAWATGTATPPKRYEGPMLTALQKLDYIPIAR